MDDTEKVAPSGWSCDAGEQPWPCQLAVTMFICPFIVALVGGDLIKLHLCSSILMMGSGCSDGQGIHLDFCWSFRPCRTWAVTCEAQHEAAGTR